MGSAASNPNRVSSADLSREEGRFLGSVDVVNNNRPQSSSPARSRTDNVQGHSLKKHASSIKTEVTVLSTANKEEKKGGDSHSAFSNDEKRKIREYELQLAKVESHNLDLMEQLSALKKASVFSSKQSSVLPPLVEQAAPLPETVHAKDQYIVKLEKDLQAAHKEVTTVRQKLKKRIKALTNQLQEVRQEASINQMEMKAVISQQNEQIEKLKSVHGEGQNQDGSSHSKIIVELSNQLSEQADQISLLKSELTTKDHRLRELEQKTTEQNPPSSIDMTPNSVDRLPSGRGKRCHKNNEVNKPKGSSFSGPNYHSNAGATSSNSHAVTPIFERQSTALSDSDSDWELDSVPSKIHSAPVGARIKSAVSVSSSMAKEDTTSLQGNDDSILNVTANPDMFHENDLDSSVTRKGKPFKRSALKTHLERKKNTNQTNGLIGPSLAFASKGKEAPSDTSCEPTPRCADRKHLPGFPSLQVVNTVSH